MDLEKIATSAIVSSISKTDTLIKNRVGMAIFIYMKIPDIRRRILKEYLLRLRGKMSRQNR